MNSVYFILAMLMYCAGGGLNLGLAIAYIKERKYIRGGFSMMLAISLALCMAELIFRVGGTPIAR